MTPDCRKCVIQCPRCHGTGILARFMHVSKGLCFECNGARQVTRTILSARRRYIGIQANARREVPACLAIVRIIDQGGKP